MPIDKKRGYNVIQNDSTQYTISSTIYLVDTSGVMTIAQRAAYGNYIKNNIEQIWSSSTNDGLNLTAPFTSKGKTISTQINIVWLGGPVSLNDGEICISVFQGAGRSYISTSGDVTGNVINSNSLSHRTGAFFYQNASTNPNEYIPTAASGGANVFAHEFGHVLGLADRYIGLVIIRDNSGNPPYSTNGTGSINNYQIIYHGEDAGNATFPMYLKGRYNPVSGLYTDEPYDIDYSEGYGWLNNLMSNPSGVVSTGSVSVSLFNMIYGEYTNLIAAITKKQLDIVLDKSVIEDEEYKDYFDRNILVKKYNQQTISNFRFTENGGTFLGLRVNPNNVNGDKIICSDENIMLSTTDQSTSGRGDSMDYRMSRLKLVSNGVNIYEPKKEEDFNGYFNIFKNNNQFGNSEIENPYNIACISYNMNFKKNELNNLIKEVKKFKPNKLKTFKHNREIYNKIGFYSDVCEVDQYFWNRASPNDFLYRSLFIPNYSIYVQNFFFPVAPNTVSNGWRHLNRGIQYRENNDRNILYLLLFFPWRSEIIAISQNIG